MDWLGLPGGMNVRPFVLVIELLLLAGCSTVPGTPAAPTDEAARASSLAGVGDYHGAMRALPGEMAAWDEYGRATGSTAEGAAGYLYSTTMSAIATDGDADWGKILDDPGIPYGYKVDMIFGIVEARLGKGSAWSPWHTGVVIIPRSASVHSWREVSDLLRQAITEEAAAGDSKDSHP
jgi:hypothetical protein